MSKNEKINIFNDVSHIKDMKTILENTKKLIEKSRKINQIREVKK